MKRFVLAVAASLMACGAAAAQPPQDMLAGRVEALERRVAELERMLAPSPVIRAMPAAPTQPTAYYYAAQTEASFGASACGPGGCGPAQTTGRVGLFGGAFRRR